MTWADDDVKTRGLEAIQMILSAKSSVSEQSKLLAMEIENLRLMRLVGELLVRNQQLRQELKG